VGAEGSALEAPDERVRSAASPQAVELGGVPSGLERDLRDADGVRRGAGRSVGEALRVNRVVHVRLVVGAVKVLAVPARSEVVGGEDTARAGLAGHIRHDSTSAAAAHALVAETSVVLRLSTWRSHRHAETLAAPC